MEDVVPQLRDSVSRSQLRFLRNDKRGCKLKYFSLITDYLDLYEKHTAWVNNSFVIRSNS